MSPNSVPINEAILENIRIATPCDADWASMKGNDLIRHCSQCRLNVYNISAMSRREAAALITGAEGRLCLRLFRRPDGTVITQDCWARLRAARRRGMVAFVCTLVLVAAGQLWIQLAGLGALSRWHSRREPPRAVAGAMMMGSPAVPPPPRVSLPVLPESALGEAVMGDVLGPEPALMGKIAPPQMVRRKPISAAVR